MNSVIPEEKLGPLTSLRTEFQMLGPSVLSLFFIFLTTKLFFLLAECETFLKYVCIVCMKSGFTDFKVSKTSIASISTNDSLRWLAAPPLIVSYYNWSNYHYTTTANLVPVFSLFSPVTMWYSRNVKIWEYKTIK